MQPTYPMMSSKLKNLGGFEHFWQRNRLKSSQVDLGQQENGCTLQKSVEIPELQIWN